MTKLPVYFSVARSLLQTVLGTVQTTVFRSEMPSAMRPKLFIEALFPELLTGVVVIMALVWNGNEPLNPLCRFLMVRAQIADKCVFKFACGHL